MKSCLKYALLLCTAFASAGYADTICTMAGCTVTIAADPNSATGNFQAPGLTATSGYTISSSDDGTNFYVNLFDADSVNGLPFANLYFDTIASTPNTGSNLGFEFGQTPNDAFIPGGLGGYLLAGTGVSETFSEDASGISINVVIPNSFFLTDPLNMGFTETPNDTLVSLHLSQSFGYSVVGGSASFPAPVELGDAIVGDDTTVPEPSTVLLFGVGVLGLAIKRIIA